jgi:Polyketide cyclase / dehydrase and lipid transport
MLFAQTRREDVSMATIRFQVESPLDSEHVLAALTDFSDRRPELWPAIDPNVYRVHELTNGSALVTEGTDVMGGIWATELYQWNGSTTVRATVEQSNFWHPGGTWELTAAPRDGGGSVLQVTRDRRPKNAKARVFEVMMRVVGARILAKELLKAPAISSSTRSGG